MSETHKVMEGRYEIGYNRPVAGAFGDSPKEWHTVNRTDDLAVARSFKFAANMNGHKAAIIDTTTMQVVDDET